MKNAAKKRSLLLGAVLLGAAVLLSGVVARNNIRDQLDAPGDKPLLKFQAPPGYNVSALAFSRDGAQLSGVSGLSSYLWDAKTGANLSPTPTAAGATNAALSSTGDLVAVPDDGRIVRRVPMQRERRSLTFDAQGNRRIVTKTVTVMEAQRTNGGVRLWNVATGKRRQLFRIADGETAQLSGGAKNIAFSPDGKTLFCQSRQVDTKQGLKSTAQIWNIASGELLRQASRFSSDGFYWWTPTFSPDGKTLWEAVAEHDAKFIYQSTGRVLVNDSFSGATQFTLDTGGLVKNSYNPSQLPLTFSPDGKLIALAWNSMSGGYSHDGQDGTIYLWDLASRKLLWKYQKLMLQPRVLAFSPDSKSLAFGGNDYETGIGMAIKGWLQVRDAQTGKLRKSLTEETDEDRRQQNWKNRELRLQYAIPPLRNYLNALRTKRIMRAPYAAGDSGPVNALAWSPDGARLAAGYGDNSIKIWKAP